MLNRHLLWHGLCSRHVFDAQILSETTFPALTRKGCGARIENALAKRPKMRAELRMVMRAMSLKLQRVVREMCAPDAPHPSVRVLTFLKAGDKSVRHHS